MVTHPLRLAALLARSIRGPRVSPIRAAGDRLLRGPATADEIAEATALWEAVAAHADPVGTMLGLLRVLCEDAPRGIGLDRAVTQCAARDGHDVREGAGRALLAEHTRRAA